MEVLKLFNEMFIMSNRLPIPFLSHFFNTAGWNQRQERARFIDSQGVVMASLAPPSHLTSTIRHFHLRHVESADYRSAYHQVCDWFYGWNVTDVTEVEEEYSDGEDDDDEDEDEREGEGGEGGGGGKKQKKKRRKQDDIKEDEVVVEQHFRMRRVPRDINLTVEAEKVECDRIIKTFETLFAVSRRVLKKISLDIEEEIPRLGQGVSTLQNRGGVGGSTMGQQRGASGASEDDISLRGDDKKAKVDVERIWAKRGRSRDREQEASDPQASNDVEQDFDIGDSMDSLDRQMESLLKQSRLTMDGVVVKKKTTNKDLVPPHEKREETEGISRPGSSSRQASVMQVVEGGDGKNEQTIADGNTPMNAAKSATGNENTAAAEGHEAATTGFAFFGTKAHLKQVPDLEDETRKALQRDINHIYREVDKATEYTLVALTCGIVVLAFSQLTDDREKFVKFCQHLNELSCDFVATTLKTVWDLLNRELPGEVELADIRHPPTLKTKLRKVMEMRRNAAGRIPNMRIGKLHSKFALLHDLFITVDVHLFPHFVWAHQEGCKSAQFSSYDPSLWLTGGYDCIVRIIDLGRSPSTTNNNKAGGSGSAVGMGATCLAQYVGHRSVVTDARFVKDDTHIVSCSFDRTIKIWNAQSATCEKTLTGHTDGVTTCDVTPDSRVIASGSIDGTVRLWDFTTGELHCVLKKHTRWVKIVQFTHDGKHLITGGLDRRIYLWDTKLLVNARNVTHSRCFENHVDYILDVATTKPSLLLSTSRDSTVRITDYLSGHEYHSVHLGSSWACTVAFSGDGEFFATGSFDNMVKIYRTKGAELVRQVRVFNLGILCVRFPRDLSHVVVGTTEGFLQKVGL